MLQPNRDVEHEDEHVLAFRHTKPSYAEHIVVVPKAHIADFAVASPKSLTQLLPVIQRQAHKTLQRTGACRVITNLGSYQDSKHLHWHIVSGNRLL